MPDTHRSAARLPAVLVAAVLGGALVLGALLGALAGSTRSPSYQATTVVSILPDDAVTATQAGATTDQDATDFIQSELVVINSRALRAVVQQQLHLPALPSVSASQQGTTYVVDITASARTASEATRIADATRSAYDTRRSAELTDDVRTAQTAVAQQISMVRAEIATTPGASTNGSSALQQEYARLLAVSSSLQLAAGQAGAAVTTIQPATSDSGGLSTTVTWGLGGAVLGALVGALALVTLRRARPLVRGLDDLDALGASVVLPVFERGGPRGARSARLLASRLREPDPRHGSVTVLVGAHPWAATHDLAMALASTYAKHARVIVVSSSPDLAELLPDRIDPAKFGRSRITAAGLTAVAGSRTSPVATALVGTDHDLRRLVDNGLFEAARQAGCSIVAEMPPLAESDLGVAAAAQAGRVTLVATQSRTRRADLDEAVEVLAARGVPTIEVLLCRRERRLRRGAIGTAVTARTSEASGAPEISAPRRNVRPAIRPGPAVVGDADAETADSVS